MKCRCCHSVMTVERRESEAGATTTWHVCSLCHQVRMTSEPVARTAGEPRASDLVEDERGTTESDTFHSPYAIL